MTVKFELDLLSVKRFKMFANMVKRSLRRHYGVHIKLSALHVEGIFNAWSPQVEARLTDRYQGILDNQGNIVDAVMALEMARLQLGYLCAYIANEPGLLRVARIEPRTDRLVDVRDAFKHYPQQLFALIACAQMLRAVTYFLTRRKIEVTGEVMWRLILLASRSHNERAPSLMRDFAQVLDPLEDLSPI